MTADPSGGFDPYRSRIDRRLEALLPSVFAGQEALEEATRDALLAPGKRLRPLVTVLAAEDLGGDGLAAIDAGCAVEMIHAASLVLDDLPCMDDAKLRRGLPAIHVGHGEDLAVLVAVGAIAGAFGTLAGLTSLSAEARVETVAILSRAMGAQGLVGGQFEDLRGGRVHRPLADIAAANSLKTGSLFIAAAEMGAVLAGAPAEARGRLAAFGAEIGHAFQLLDDLLDRAPDALAIGKDVGKDAGKSTILSLIGRTPVRRRIERHLDAARARLREVFGAGSRLEALIGAVFDQALPVAAGSDTPERRADQELPRPVSAHDLR